MIIIYINLNEVWNKDNDILFFNFDWIYLIIGNGQKLKIKYGDII